MESLLSDGESFLEYELVDAGIPDGDKVANAVHACATRKEQKKAREVPAQEANGPMFVQAKLDEITSIIETKSVETGDETNATNVVPMRLVCTWRLDEQGRPVKAKARLVAIGFRDRRSDAENLSDAATPTKEGARVVVHFSVQRQESLHKWDVKTAFLKSGQRRPWQQSVWLRPPPEAGLPPGKIWKALLAIYGLKDGPYEWPLEVFGVLTEELHFAGLQSGISVFVYITNDGVCHGSVCLHFDDLLWHGDHLMAKQMHILRDRLGIGSEETDNFLYLGIQLTTHINWDGKLCRFLDQKAYCMSITKVPLSMARRKNPDDEADDVELGLFRQILGQLMWLVVCTRPDLGFDCSMLAREVHRLPVRHLALINKVAERAQMYADCGLLYQWLCSARERPQVLALTDSSLNNMDCWEHYEDVGWVKETTDTQQCYMVLAVPPRNDVTDFVTRAFIFNLLTRKSQNAPRKTNATFGAETQALWTGEDAAAWICSFLSEVEGWIPIPDALPYYDCFVLTGCGSIVDHLKGMQQIGTEKRLLGYLSQLRERLLRGEIRAIGHLPGCVNLSDTGTKYASPLLEALIAALNYGWCDLTSDKADLTKVARHKPLR